MESFICYLKNQNITTVTTVLTDNGKEYVNDEYRKMLASRGVKFATTINESPATNRVAERFHQTIFSRVRAVLNDTNLPKNMWAELAKAQAYIYNQTPSWATDNAIPYEQLYQKPVNLSYFVALGKVGFVNSRANAKLDARATEKYCVGYGEQQRGYRMLDEVTNTAKTERDITWVDRYYSESQTETQNDDLEDTNGSEAIAMACFPEGFLTPKQILEHP
jgi:hypothetical protein